MSAPGKPDRAAWIEGPSARCNPLPERTQEPWRLILLGAPGVGKGTQAALLHLRLMLATLQPATCSEPAEAVRSATRVPQ
jgi:hypothetical protein